MAAPVTDRPMAARPFAQRGRSLPDLRQVGGRIRVVLFLTDPAKICRLSMVQPSAEGCVSSAYVVQMVRTLCKKVQ